MLNGADDPEVAQPPAPEAPRKRGRPRKHPRPEADATLSLFPLLPPSLVTKSTAGAPKTFLLPHTRYATGDPAADAMLTDIFYKVQTFLTNIDASITVPPDADAATREAFLHRRSTQDLREAAAKGDTEALGILQDLIRSVGAHLLQETTQQINQLLGIQLFPDEPNENLHQERGGQGIADMKQADALRDAAIDRLVRWLLNATFVDPPPPAEKETLPERATDYSIYTTMEIDALSRATADGRNGSHWNRDEQLRQLRWNMEGIPYQVIVHATQEEQISGISIDALERVVNQADANGAFVALYVMRLLAPRQGTVPYPTWVDLDDVAEKVGFQPDKCTAEERAMIRNRIWSYIRFLARAVVTGERSGQYYDRHAKKAIPTRIASPLFGILGREIELVNSDQEPPVPRQIELVLSTEWARILTHPSLAQYLPMGEMLGAIPPGKPSGSWARVIGLALANLWRRLPQQTVTKTLRPTREELLSRYAMSVASYQEILKSGNPRRAITYWAEALDILVEKQILLPVGEAARGVAFEGQGPDGKELPRKNWQRPWLETQVELMPGMALSAFLLERANRKQVSGK